LSSNCEAHVPLGTNSFALRGFLFGGSTHDSLPVPEPTTLSKPRLDRVPNMIFCIVRVHSCPRFSNDAKGDHLRTWNPLGWVPKRIIIAMSPGSSNRFFGEQTCATGCKAGLHTDVDVSDLESDVPGCPPATTRGITGTPNNSRDCSTGFPSPQGPPSCYLIATIYSIC
jgi:hypothetical protein